MRFRGRLVAVGVVVISGVVFKINAYLTLGYVPLMEWILNAVFIFPAWWCGLQFDKAKFLSKEIKKKDDEINRLLVKQLDDTEQRFKSLFVHNSDPIFTFNLDGKIIDANMAAEKLLGYTYEELKNKTGMMLIDPVDLHTFRVHYQSVKEGISQKFTSSMIRKDGRKRDIRITMIPIISDNEFIGVYGIAKDITETKLAEEMIRRSDKLSVVGQLAAGVAHEIRNPLTTLKGFVQLLSDIDKKYKKIMLTELDRINLIVSEFLILAKPQMTNYQLKDLNSILNELISLLEVQTNINNIQISKEFALNLPLINCEQNQLKQVFINLLKNAIEAMPDGGEITIKTHVLNDEMVTISIIDRGHGIAEDQISKLGEPFNTTKENGTGLGLMVCFKIVENHGGKINITSQLNKGTSVDVILPINTTL
jgi:PAS domain S-box-containing protein